MAKICGVVDCFQEVYAKGYCWRHYTQLRRHGRILERTRFDLNEFIFDECICYIQLYDRNGEKIEKATVDAADYLGVKNYKWCLFLSKNKAKSERRYVQSRIEGKLIFLHQFLMGARSGIDHRDGDGLNNRRGNLRLCTSSQNNCNRKIGKRNSSGFKGVSFYLPTSKWLARIGYKGKRRCIGYFNSPEEAAKVYNDKAKILHGEFARLNKI
jgi:hypothetical protein